VDIYSWLPFTQQDLAAAAAVTEKFLVDYNTYSYTETADGYVAKMNGLIHPAAGQHPAGPVRAGRGWPRSGPTSGRCPPGPR
jgi:hypothetical protein